MAVGQSKFYVLNSLNYRIWLLANQNSMSWIHWIIEYGCWPIKILIFWVKVRLIHLFLYNLQKWCYKMDTLHGVLCNFYILWIKSPSRIGMLLKIHNAISRQRLIDWCCSILAVSWHLRQRKYTKKNQKPKRLTQIRFLKEATHYHKNEWQQKHGQYNSRVSEWQHKHGQYNSRVNGWQHKHGQYNSRVNEWQHKHGQYNSRVNECS